MWIVYKRNSTFNCALFSSKCVMQNLKLKKDSYMTLHVVNIHFAFLKNVKVLYYLNYNSNKNPFLFFYHFAAKPSLLFIKKDILVRTQAASVANGQKCKWYKSLLNTILLSVSYWQHKKK